MCGALTPSCRYDNSTINFIGDKYCPDTECSSKLCLHKKILQFLGRSDYQGPKDASECQVRNNLFADKTNSFFLSFGSVVYIFEETPKTIQDVFEDFYCSGKYREKGESLGGSVTTPISIYGFGTSGAWWFVHKFHITRACKGDKNRQNTVFLC